MIFGVGLLALKPAKRSAIESGLASISDAFFEFINLIMKLAPVGTFGAIAYAVGSNGTDMLISLAWLVLVFYAALAAFIVVVLGAVSLIFGINLPGLLRFIKNEIIVILGTASSESVLPKLLQKLPAYGASRQTVGLLAYCLWAMHFLSGAWGRAYRVSNSGHASAGDYPLDDNA